ncbi:MAG: MmcQ/YjbR family DNA-binding protein [Gammaproteobacteria bacterium]
MTYNEFNTFCDSLAVTSHVVQWGHSHVWKVSDKVFAIGGWQKTASPAFTFKVSEISFEILKDLPGLRPAPYFASRGMSWIQHYDEPGLPNDELKEYILESHRILSLGFSKKKRKSLGLYSNEL